MPPMHYAAFTYTPEWMESFRRELTLAMEGFAPVPLCFEYSHGSAEDIRQETEKHLQILSLIKMGPSLSNFIPLECLVSAVSALICFCFVDRSYRFMRNVLFIS